MAENKKSFLLYADLIHTFEELTDEEAGRLIKHLFRYVNDEEPVAPDRLTKLVFEPIMRQLKRDLQRWDTTKEENSRNGQIGNLKRWNMDLYKRFMAKDLTLDEAIKIANDRKLSPPDGAATKPVAPVSRKVAKIAVNVTDNVTVNDTVNGIDDVDVKRAKASSSASTIFPLEDCSSKLLIGQNEFTLLATRKTGKTQDQLNNLLVEFIIEQRSLSKLAWQNETDAKSHFINWVNKQPNEQEQKKSRFVM